jgi:predicted Zn-dependent peptidase
VTAPAVKVDRSRLPAAAGSSRFRFPAIEKSVLPNGLGVWTVKHEAIPIVTSILLIERGSSSDPPGKEGLAAITVDMLDEGSSGRSAIEMHEALARIGAQFDTDLGSDAAAISVTVLHRFLEQGLAILADMVVRPTIAETDFARVRQLRLHRLIQLRDMPGAIADRAFVRLLYGEHPYGHTPIGSEISLAGMSVADVRSFHAQSITPAAATLIAVGDCDHDEIRRIASDVFEGWGGAGGGDALAAVGPAPSPARLNIVPRPGAPQSELRLGHVAVSRSTPDYHALVAANMVLGGQFVSRINLNLREEKGLTYGARTSFDFRRLPGPFALQVSVQTGGTAQAIAEALDEIGAIRGRRPVTREELTLGVAALTRGYARSFETAEQIARAAMQLALYDLPDDYFVEYVPRMEAITPDEATAAASRHLDPDRLVALAVGDLDAIEKDLPALGLGDPVVLSPATF